MGRRAKKAPVQTKKRVKLAKLFKCPFCANEETVECKMDNKKGIGSLSCRLCGAAYQMPIHHLHEPIDVFSEWLDDCEAAQNPSAAAARDDDGGEGDVPRYQDDDNEEDEIPESSGLGARSKSSGGGAKQPQRQTITDLGLGDSEDDDDDE